MLRAAMCGTLTLGLTAGLAGPAVAAAKAVPATARVSVATSGTEADNYSVSPAISRDGRYVAFRSAAANLVPGDTNGTADIFLRDQRAGTTIRASSATDGSQANGDNYAPAISADGRFVSWISLATNLVAGDTNGADDIFVHDLQTKITTRVSVATDGSQARGRSQNPSLSADGRYVAFESEAPNLAPDIISTNIFVHDRQTGVTELVSRNYDGSRTEFPGNAMPRISADGRYVAFESDSPKLVPVDVNGKRDVFLWERVTRATTLVSVPQAGAVADDHTYRPTPSDGGRYVAFLSYASNMVPGDTNSAADVFVRDLTLGTTTRVSVAKDGTENSSATNNPVMSADGRYIAFDTRGYLGTDDAWGFQDVFVKDRVTGAVSIVSSGLTGKAANSQSGDPAISADGRSVGFYSYATDVVKNDTNGQVDAFVQRR
jgi:Tol biopolymer transport system component